MSTDAPVVMLMGPTASGKSDVALSLAEQFPVEIVTVDSAQVYRGMDIGTAKPDAAARARAPHHLIDLIDPTDAYSAARFLHDALAAIEQIRARRRIPLLVGGTMLYFKALREGLSRLPGADPAVRRALDRDAARHGWPTLHARLAEVDPATAERLEPADAQRIQRALEVFALTGVPLSVLQATRQPVPMLGAYLSIALVPDRARLHERIARRFDAMLAAGLVDEVRGLVDRYPLGPELPSMRCVGYRQVLGVLLGRHPAATLRERAVAATRQLAKRQFTWLRQIPASAFDPDARGTGNAIAKLLRERVSRIEVEQGPGMATAVHPGA